MRYTADPSGWRSALLKVTSRLSLILCAAFALSLAFFAGRRVGLAEGEVRPLVDEAYARGVMDGFADGVKTEALRWH